MLDDIIHLSEHAAPSICGTQAPWPLPATNPAIMITGISDDGSLYPVEKIEAHVRALHHVAISVFVFCGDELLIQRRAMDKYHCGGQWANTCCTHPHFGESETSAATRRVNEELGFQIPVQKRFVVEYSADVGNGLWEREQVHMFRADVKKSEISIKPNQDEVCETRWINADNLGKELIDNPTSFTPWFRLYIDRFPGLDI